MSNEFRKIKFDVAAIINGFNIYYETNELTELEKGISESFEIPEILEVAGKKLSNEGDFWNEEELKMFFISVLFMCAELEEKEKIKLFYERTLSTEVDGHKISVICDCLLATSQKVPFPQKPYFFLQEFKKQKNADDAEGQMLLAMIAAQFINQDNNEVYGAFVQGKFWNFTVLKERNYSVSRSYDASQKDQLQMIFAILKNLKRLILANLD
jgi:hypothetical protein